MPRESTKSVILGERGGKNAEFWAPTLLCSNHLALNYFYWVCPPVAPSGLFAAAFCPSKMSRTILQLISPLLTSQKVNHKLLSNLSVSQKKASKTQPKLHEKTPVIAQRDLRGPALLGPRVSAAALAVFVAVCAACAVAAACVPIGALLLLLFLMLCCCCYCGCFWAANR